MYYVKRSCKSAAFTVQFDVALVWHHPRSECHAFEPCSQSGVSPSNEYGIEIGSREWCGFYGIGNVDSVDDKMWAT